MMRVIGVRIATLAVIATIATGNASAQDTKKYAHEFYHDFRGKPLPNEIRVFGDPEVEFIKEEPVGFRIALPKTWIHKAGGVGCETNFGIKGDFEATGTFEILHAEEPPKGFGVGPSLSVHMGAPANKRATLKRVRRTAGQQMVVWEHVPAKNAKYAGRASECPEMLLRLRLRRTGTTIHYQWAPGAAGGAYEEVRAEPNFGAEDIVAVRMSVFTGRKPCDADVRFVDLRIRSDGVSAAAKDGVVFTLPKKLVNSPEEAPTNRTSLLMAMLCGSCLLTLLGFTLMVVLLRRRRAARSGPVSEPAEAD